MKLKIEIKMDNEAFGETSGDECARILRRLAEMDLASVQIPAEFHRVLRDINGNKVGEAKVTR
jgi:hypothetical protein